MRPFLLVALLPSLAFAESSTLPQPQEGRKPVPRFGTLRFGDASAGVSIHDLDIALRSGPADVRVDATFTLSTTAKTVQDSLLVLDVPRGAQVTFLGMTIAGAPQRISALVDAREAFGDYTQIVHHEEDPALLEWVGSTETSERLRLRVYPMQRGQSARMEVILTMPSQDKLVVSPGPRAIPKARVELDGARAFSGTLADARTLALPAPAIGATPVSAAHLDADHSLFIGEPIVAPRDGYDPPPAPELTAAERATRRAGYKMPPECLANPLAPSCM